MDQIRVGESSEPAMFPLRSESHWSSLLEQARAGEENARGSLLERCRAYLLRIANQQIPQSVRGLVPPSDVVQEAFLAAHTHLHTFRGKTEPEMARWLRSILINLVRRRVSLYRRETLKRKPLDIVSHPAVHSEFHGEDFLSRSLQDPAAEEGQHRLLLAMAALPDHYRQVVELRNLERKSFQEIGNSLGRSPDAARKLWVRALTMIREHLQQTDDTHPSQSG